MTESSEQFPAPVLLAGSTRDSIALVPVEPGRISSRRILKAPGISVVRMSLDEGEALDSHQAQVPLLIEVIAGSVDVAAGDWSERLTAGASLYVPPRLPHALRAVGPVHLQILSLHSVAAPRP